VIALIEIVHLLLSQSIWPWLGVLAFGAIGYWYGYVSWFVSRRRLQVLVSERKRLEASIATMRKELGNQSEVVLTGERSDDPDYDDFTVLPGIDTFACARLHQKGIQYFDQLAELEDLDGEELERFRLSFGIGKFQLEEWRWAWDEEIERETSSATQPSELKEGPNVEILPMLGPVFKAKPAETDQLTLMDGISLAIEERLHRNGIFLFSQIAAWEEPALEDIERKVALPVGAIKARRWKEQAQLLGAWVEGLASERFVAPQIVDHRNVMESSFRGQAGLRVDQALGMVYDFEPDIVDKLTDIPGVGSEVQQRLHQLGVFRFRQISSWSTPVLCEIAKRLEIDHQVVESEKWIANAGLLDRKKYSASKLWDSARPTKSEIKDGIRSQFEAEDLKADEDLGIVYQDRPDHADDLESLGSLTVSQIFTLNASGVWCFRQIATWSETNIDTFAELLGISPELIYHENWLGKALGSECKASQSPSNVEYAISSQSLLRQGADLDERFGLVYAQEPSQVDDLQKIRGVGPKLEERLKACGIYQFHQIALWTPDVAQQFAERLPGVKGRLLNDRWQEQARALHELTLLSPLKSSDRNYDADESDVHLTAEP
tara:strand:+ start:13142 stop:14956 length:1815 start_codon:yes stop_codon:yes gene_type:complete